MGSSAGRERLRCAAREDDESSELCCVGCRHCRGISRSGWMVEELVLHAALRLEWACLPKFGLGSELQRAPVQRPAEPSSPLPTIHHKQRWNSAGRLHMGAFCRAVCVFGSAAKSWSARGNGQGHSTEMASEPPYGVVLLCAMIAQTPINFNTKLLHAAPEAPPVVQPT